MQLHICMLDSLKNNILQKVSDIKDNIFNVALFFTGLFSLGQGAYLKVIMKDIIKKTISKIIFNFGDNVLNNNIIMKYIRLTIKHELKVLQ
ncbi:hypothetical protein psyc5s11_03220 [Clostridium gelidum]|uniref:Uncharacterized protein n=1 Tax=Clostridium gelidum TaxID=704125 RepID=A0ABN6ITS0_9CLOT|nr:hypothetical protein psyc5s11_03220 [Clostridium gelidum]